MIRFIFDTNAVAAVMKNDAWMVERLRALAPNEIGIPQPTLAEIEYGIQRLPQSKRRVAIESQLDRVRSVFVHVAWTDDVSRCFGELKAQLERRGQLIDDFDIAIAAHALSLDATLVTRDLDHARITGLRVERW